MQPKINIALIQLHPKHPAALHGLNRDTTLGPWTYINPLSPSHNLDKASQHIKVAASQGAHLAILPEYALTSWYPGSAEFRSSCKIALSCLGAFKELAKAHRIAIVPGTIVEELPDGSLANVCYFISSGGEVVSRYTKRNLWHSERDVLSPVHAPHKVFDTEFGKVGLLICWDLAFPEAARELVTKGAKLIIVPTMWLLDDAGDQGKALNPLAEKTFLEALIVCRAFENTCAVAFVNAADPASKEERTADLDASGGTVREYLGLSQVGMPLLGALGKMSAEEGMEIVEVDMKVLDVSEGVYKLREDLARKDWHYRIT